MSNIEVRRGIKSDRPALFDLLTANRMSYKVSPEEFIVAIVDGQLAGAFRLEWENKAAYIRPVVVDSQYQGRGIGRLLIQTALQETPVLHIVGRRQAVNFYERVGFHPLDWEQVPARYQNECENCPDRNNCNPVSMTLNR